MANKSMFYSLKIGALIARAVPRKLGIQIIQYFGFLYGMFPTNLQKRVIKIHQRISPHLNQKQLRRRAAQVVASYSQYWWDVFWMSSDRTKSEIKSIVNIEGRNYFDEAVERSKENGVGIILALPHMGSWEIAGAWLSMVGYPPVVVAERLNPPELFELFTKTRTSAGMTVLAHDDHPTSKLLTALKQGKVICLVADRDISKKGLEVEFFGARKTMPTGPAALALKTGAVILPVCMYLNQSSKVDISFSSPMIVDPGNGETDRAETISRVTKELSGVFQDMISKDPAQWHVLHDEWSKDG